MEPEGGTFVEPDRGSGTEPETRELEAEIRTRLRLLQRAMAEQGMDLALILQNVDLFYYTGTIQDGLLVVPADGEPVLFVRRVLERAREESPLRDVRGYARLQEIADYLLDTGRDTGAMGLELDVLPAGLYLRLQDLLPHATFQDISPLIRFQRAVKSSCEIELLAEGGRRFDRVLEAMREEIVPGRTEYQVYQRFVLLLLEQRSSLRVRT
ncbi:MAG: aminopeptidase P family N-terminal domain-containing protein, partial [Spirochaetota bacterium]